MKMAGLEELEDDKDVNHLRTTMRLDDDDKGAAKHFKEKIEQSLCVQTVCSGFRSVSVLSRGVLAGRH